MKYLIAIISALSLFYTSLSAEVIKKTYTKTTTGEGYGITYEQAVDNALAQAVLKLNGAYVKTTQNAQTTTVKSNNENELFNKFNQQIRKATNGRFSGFEVIEKEQTTDGFRVVVNMKKTTTIKKYKAPGIQSKRRRIIVVPSLEPNNYSIMGRDSEQVLRDLRRKIESQIHNTRKFNLLDRQVGGAYSDEEAIIKNYSSKDEVLKLRRVLGTDYILVYTVSDASTKSKIVSKLTGTKTSSSIDVVAGFQVIIMATREIKFSKTITLNYKSGNNSLKDYDRILENIASTIVLDMQSAIYPPRIEKISNKQAVFTQSLSVGTTLECFKKGARIYDSYTKEATGYEEIYTALVQISSNNPKMSYAKVLDGKISKGNICRIKTQDARVAPEVEGKDVKDITPVPNGGFIF